MTISRYKLWRSAPWVLCALAAWNLSAQPDTPALPSLAPIIERVSPAVVNISVSGSVQVQNPLAQDPLFRRFFPVPPEGRRDFQSAGSGVIVDAENGYVLTNHHVVENADRITVTLADNRSLQAEVVGSDANSDVAVEEDRPHPLLRAAQARIGRRWIVGVEDALEVAHLVPEPERDAVLRGRHCTALGGDLVIAQGAKGPADAGAPQQPVDQDRFGIAFITLHFAF